MKESERDSLTSDLMLKRQYVQRNYLNVARKAEKSNT